jgi:hypothetical protein
VYKLTKPSSEKPSVYVVINSLPVTSAIMQRCHVNVNVHVTDPKPGIPDTDTLADLTSDAVALLHRVDASGILIDFESQEYIRDERLNEHYSNIRLFVKFVN